MDEQSLTTEHVLISADARKLAAVTSHSVDLVVTSPPYPMISMWDDTFCELSNSLGQDIIARDPVASFELMHQELDKVWSELNRVMKDGGIACINIGDATRTEDQQFRLYSNHTRITAAFIRMGFSNLPNIIWKKPTNAPNKFMGSGTLPVGAYVTLEHEYILIFRKGMKRTFDTAEEKALRKNSAFFWEERNRWFSDTWDLKGTAQKMDGKLRTRSAAYPLELPHRLINMYSMMGDRVLDPFNGTGTTTQAAIINGRNSIGYDLDPTLNDHVLDTVTGKKSLFEAVLRERLEQHQAFVDQQPSGSMNHDNAHYGFPVKTRQEVDLQLPQLMSLERRDNLILAHYK